MGCDVGFHVVLDSLVPALIRMFSTTSFLPMLKECLRICFECAYSHLAMWAIKSMLVVVLDVRTAVMLPEQSCLN